ncbi:MAG: hypothetical protein Q9222_003801 [Ikaeria aurantiellina]
MATPLALPDESQAQILKPVSEHQTGLHAQQLHRETMKVETTHIERENVMDHAMMTHCTGHRETQKECEEVPVSADFSRDDQEKEQDKQGSAIIAGVHAGEAERDPSSSSDSMLYPDGCDFKTTFRMVIHRLNKEPGQRIACLDTCADVDAISHRVVQDLGLRKVPYQGPSVKPLGGSFQPQWQVTLDWNVAGFPRTYPTTFIVFEEDYSEEFDVLLGKDTIKAVRFYKRNNSVWMTTREGDLPITTPP